MAVPTIGVGELVKVSATLTAVIGARASEMERRRVPVWRVQRMFPTPQHIVPTIGEGDFVLVRPT